MGKKLTSQFLKDIDLLAHKTYTTYLQFFSSHQKISEQISREVDILTEIAELQMKLVQKLGKKTDLKLHEGVLSDPSSNCLKISKEKIVKSIRDEIYAKKQSSDNKVTTTAWTDMKVHVVTDLKQNKSVDIPNGSQNIKDFLDTDSEPMVIFDLKGRY